jgi:hypothetical protein
MKKYIGFGLMMIMSALSFIYAFIQKAEAEKQREKAEYFQQEAEEQRRNAEEWTYKFHLQKTLQDSIAKLKK